MLHRPLLKVPRIWSYVLALLPRSNLSERPAAASAEASFKSQAHHLKATGWGYHRTVLPLSGHGVHSEAGVPLNVTKERSSHHLALPTPRGPDNVSLLAVLQQLDFRLAQPLLLEDHHPMSHADAEDHQLMSHADTAQSWHYGAGVDKIFELAHDRLPKAAKDAYFSFHGGGEDHKPDIKMPDGQDVPWSIPNRVNDWKEHSESSLKHINDMLEKAKKTKQELYEKNQDFMGNDLHQSRKINDVIQTLGDGTSSSASSTLAWLNPFGG